MTYKIFQDESADILVGTQMVVQGFDFPRVTLVGIIDADTALYHPDFRAAEKTYQWVSQAGGRAGRSPIGGQVIIQSSMPDHYALQSASQSDYEAFYIKELEFRRALFYPPYSQLVLFRIESSARKDLVISESKRLAEVLKKESSLISSDTMSAGNGLQVLGPGPSAKEHLRKLLRWQILVKCSADKLTSKIVRTVRNFVPKSGVRLIIDVDPYDVL